MYEVRINKSFASLCHSLGEAMDYIEKYAEPFGSRWIILDSFGKVCYQG